MLGANHRQFWFKEVHYNQELSHKAGEYDHCLDVDSRMMGQNVESDRQLPGNEKYLQAVQFIILVRSILLRGSQLERHNSTQFWPCKAKILNRDCRRRIESPSLTSSTKNSRCALALLKMDSSLGISTTSHPPHSFLDFHIKYRPRIY